MFWIVPTAKKKIVKLNMGLTCLNALTSSLEELVQRNLVKSIFLEYFLQLTKFFFKLKIRCLPLIKKRWLIKLAIYYVQIFRNLKCRLLNSLLPFIKLRLQKTYSQCQNILLIPTKKLENTLNTVKNCLRKCGMY